MKKIFISLLVTVIAASCSKSFLERDPINKRTTESFYKTPKDALEALSAVYDVLQLGGFDNIHLISEIASDNCFGGGGESDMSWKRWDRFENDINTNDGPWTKYYQGIYRANVLLANIGNVDWGTDSANKVRYTAEARFLRAYFYFDLVRMFGNIPLVTKPLDPTEYYQPQAKPEEVYKFIAEDLEYTIANLPATAYSAIPKADYGRVTRWAAQALLARVYLYYTGYYTQNDLAGVTTKAEVRGYLQELINTSGYGIIDSFPLLWQSAGANFVKEDNKETVFAIKFTHLGLKDWNKNDGNRMMVMIGIRNKVVAPYYKGWGAATVNPKLYAAYETGDTRRTGSIISINDENLSYPETFPQYTTYFWKKYMPMNDLKPEDVGGDFQIDNFYDYVVIRYADVLLMAAELELDGDLTKAQTYYNTVRDRAFRNITHRKPLTNDAAGKALIMQERRLELALEGLRYWDLLRQGVTVAKQAIDNPSSDAQFKVDFRAETKGLLQIPQKQINLSNGTLKQNDGWSL
ncbi:RagB/SusD family nutrient uptake outer membrane protein [Chitinophaga horti]|uniref:RagB/SusD family nutrient uptake outer membrane protein n=1 Tax=Chitinophaga horti TaxID=2920382 RepID=A0ABY6J5A8_9BACT|nr:RagB/SusD family nutrient uptake outer membrane protein [Chitinophaga horti]UYQ94860.1 RagB/SusD family nutrient uptake outer membrane protein [Chitinophaga horti]